MTAAEFAALMEAAAAHLTSAQRELACRFVATLADHACAELAAAHRDRRRRERFFEEAELAGDEIGLERRRREP